ncbi:glycosyltransferase family 4 protein [Roseateles amylovorans]|uniref:Glycosyltransferase family 1 protein n=1 Tax=Roseateles amylovorans TaxID=2978473 RepID=A0ABY6AY57_9BURK|nr:glycosyltransferase family 1 protein [Roseateles amylovorans]UXH77725.1 glycosyltransferase family 1 protein [Roseateles amylovorans]
MTTAPIELEVDELPTRQRHFRVAVVTETYPPEVNGVARSIACVVQGLQARDHAVQLLRPRQAEVDRGAVPSINEVLMRGLPVPRYPHLRMGVVSKRTLVSLWASRRPDVVHIATEGPMGWSALQAARHLKLPVVSEFRTNFHAYAQHYGIGWLRRPLLAYLRKFHNRCHNTMVPNAALAGELMAQGFRHVSVIARGVDTQLFHPLRRSQTLRAQWGVAPGDPVLLHVGRLAAEKNLQLLADVWPAVRERHPRARLVLVGDGPARAELQQQLPDAIFAGMRHGEALAACYASGDLFVFPSVTETYGNVTPEALASGLPVMAYGYAAAGLLVRDGINGGLAPFNEAAAFRQRLLALLDTPQGLSGMREAARASAESLDWDGIVQGIEQVYAAAIDGTSVALRAGSQLSGMTAGAL